jgi:hypothetical protein
LCQSAADMRDHDRIRCADARSFISRLALR